MIQGAAYNTPAECPGIKIQKQQRKKKKIQKAQRQDVMGEKRVRNEARA